MNNIFNKKHHSSKYGSLKLWLLQVTQGLEQALKTATKREPTSITDEDTRKGKGWKGTSLPLLPDIRKADVAIGTLQKLLNLFGIDKKVGGVKKKKTQKTS